MMNIVCFFNAGMVFFLGCLLVSKGLVRRFATLLWRRGAQLVAGFTRALARGYHIWSSQRRGIATAHLWTIVLVKTGDFHRKTVALPGISLVRSPVGCSLVATSTFFYGAPFKWEISWTSRGCLDTFKWLKDPNKSKKRRSWIIDPLIE